MHTFLTAILPGLVLVGCIGSLGFHIGRRITERRIADSLRTDRQVGIHVLEELAQRWGVKVTHQETPGGT